MKSILPSAATAALALFALVGCSSGAGNGTGDVSFVLTDAASDELTQFEVDVSGLVLTKQDGTQVSVMPRATRVDFADLTSIGELVTTANMPSGSYTSMTMSLDFSTATVVILGQSGPATVLDTAGAPITTTLAVTVDFAVRSRPFVRVGRHQMFALDLDLDQAVTVDSGANEVRFSPVLSAEGVRRGGPRYGDPEATITRMSRACLVTLPTRSSRP